MRKLDRNGFVRSWLYTASAEPYTTDLKERNQLKLEGLLRSRIAESHPGTIMRPDYSAFKPFYSHGAVFVSASDFYSTLHLVHMQAATVLYARKETRARLVLWSYMASALYLDGVRVAEIRKPQYKPIEKTEAEVTLHEGRNEVLLVMENLGVRDTRNMVALQVIAGEAVTTGIPDQGREEEYLSATGFLDSIRHGYEKLSFPSPCPSGTVLSYRPESLEHDAEGAVEEDISGRTEIPLPPEKHFTLKLSGYARSFENIRLIKPGKSLESFEAILRSIADTKLLDRGDHGFACFYILAKKALGEEIEDEEEVFENDFRLIERRVDCSDFLVTGLLRVYLLYGMSEPVLKRFKEVLKDYRYWMTMKGADGMCFWSENHALMFYFSAYMTGKLFPDEYFHRTRMNGKELSEWGRSRVEEWLDDVLKLGFEEFYSSTYSLVTLAVLLSVHDFSEEGISQKAGLAIDNMLRSLCRQSFQGSLIAPMGRVYRDVLFPYEAGGQALMSAIDHRVPYKAGEGWIAFLAGSSYRLPEDLEELMRKPQDISVYEGNAFIHTEKRSSYILTSVDTSKTRDAWENRVDDPELSPESPLWVKSLNECFHGTTRIRSGVYGYQQHLWSAALSPECLVFANHPGDSTERTELRPGYWHGNGLMPAVKAGEGYIASIYSIGDNHPIHYTHLFFPERKFDDVVKEGSWIFARKGRGQLAIWCSGELQPYDELLHGSELRCFKDNSAYIVFASEDKGFDAFMAEVKERRPEFNEEEKRLYLDGGEILSFVKHIDRTQNVE